LHTFQNFFENEHEKGLIKYPSAENNFEVDLCVRPKLSIFNSLLMILIIIMKDYERGHLG